MDDARNVGFHHDVLLHSLSGMARPTGETTPIVATMPAENESGTAASVMQG
jgi:hypothetical protein